MSKEKKCDKNKQAGNSEAVGDVEILGIKDKKFEGRSRLSEEEREELMKERMEKRKEIREELNSK